MENVGNKGSGVYWDKDEGHIMEGKRGGLGNRLLRLSGNGGNRGGQETTDLSEGKE